MRLHAPVEVSARGPHSPIVFGRVGARAESFWQLLPAAGSSCSGGSSPGPFFLFGGRRDLLPFKLEHVRVFGF